MVLPGFRASACIAKEIVATASKTGYQTDRYYHTNCRSQVSLAQEDGRDDKIRCDDECWSLNGIHKCCCRAPYGRHCYIDFFGDGDCFCADTSTQYENFYLWITLDINHTITTMRPG